MDKQRVLYLLDEGFDAGEEDAALVHGTSTQTVMEIMRNNVLPAADNKKYSGYIHFYPIKKHMSNFSFYQTLSDSLNIRLVEELASAAAAGKEQNAYLNNLLGIPHWQTPQFKCGLQYGDIETEDELWKIITERQYNDRIDKGQLKEILTEKNKCSGIIIGINKKILEDFGSAVEIDSDELRVPEGKRLSVRIRLPQGLDEKYLQYIFPLVEREEKMLRDFVERELEN